MLNWKKILMIAGFVIIVVGIAIAIYYVFFKAPTTEPTPAEEVPPVSELPISGAGEIKPTEPTEGVTPTAPTVKVTEVTVPPEAKVESVAKGGITRVTDLDYSQQLSMTLDSTGNKLVTFDQTHGQFYSLASSGQKTALSATKFPEVQNIAWAPNSGKAILEFPDGANVLYDYVNDKQITLPKTWTDFQFSANESQIAFKDLENSSEKRFLGVASPDGSNQKYVEFLGNKAEKVDVLWSPTNQVVATYREAATSSATTLYFIGQNSENFKALEVNGQNITMQYTPDGSRLLYSAQNSFSDNKPVLYIVDVGGSATGQNHTNLNLNTWADKCTFADNQTMYCAVPKTLPSGAGWFPELADGIGDFIYKINLSTGTKSFIAEPQFEYTIDSMQVSDDGSTLFFTDKATKTVHEIKLK